MCPTQKKTNDFFQVDLASLTRFTGSDNSPETALVFLLNPSRRWQITCSSSVTDARGNSQLRFILLSIGMATLFQSLIVDHPFNPLNRI